VGGGPPETKKQQPRGGKDDAVSVLPHERGCGPTDPLRGVQANGAVHGLLQALELRSQSISLAAPDCTMQK